MGGKLRSIRYRILDGFTSTSTQGAYTSRWLSVGKGQCTDTHGNLNDSAGWSNCSFECADVQACQASCTGECVAVAYNEETHACWMYPRMLTQYVTSNGRRASF